MRPEKKRSIDYAMPNVNQCTVCHDGGSAGAVPLGPNARNLNRGDQLARWVQAGYLKGLPATRRQHSARQVSGMIRTAAPWPSVRGRIWM